MKHCIPYHENFKTHLSSITRYHQEWVRGVDISKSSWLSGKERLPTSSSRKSIMRSWKGKLERINFVKKVLTLSLFSQSMYSFTLITAARSRTLLSYSWLIQIGLLVNDRSYAGSDLLLVIVACIDDHLIIAYISQKLYSGTHEGSQKWAWVFLILTSHRIRSWFSPSGQVLE